MNLEEEPKAHFKRDLIKTNHFRYIDVGSISFKMSMELDRT